jgi:hypothetical protein
MIAIQNPSVLTKGALQIVDAYYDIRGGHNGTPGSFSLSGFGAALPATIQNMPEEQVGAIYSGDNSLTLADYSAEKTTGSVSGLTGASTSIFITRNLGYVFAANHAAHVLTVVNQSTSGAYPLSLPGIYRVSVNPGGTVAMAFVENSNYAYYARELTAAETQAYSKGSSSWPKAAVDCEPQSGPGWCLFQMQSPDNVDTTGNYYGAPLVFDHPVKALFSSDGSTAYVLSCGPECGGNNASVSLVPTAPMIFSLGKSSGLLPCNSSATSCSNSHATPMTTIAVAGGASNALISSNVMYVVGQQKMPDGYFGGYLTRIDLTANALVASTSTSPNPVSISDGTAGTASRMNVADDNTLWIGMQGCDSGERAHNSLPYGCLTMFNTSTNTVTMLEAFQGDLTGIAAVTGLHKVYVAQGGQVYIYSTANGSAMDNQFVTVTGVASDVVYMDAASDTNNTVY